MNPRQPQLRAALTLGLGALTAGTLAVIPATAVLAAPPSGSVQEQAAPAASGPGLGHGSDQKAQVQADTDRVVVKFRDGTSATTQDKVLDQTAAKTALDDPKKVKKSVQDAEVVSSKQKLDPQQQASVVKELEKKPEVEFAEADKIVKNAAASNPGTSPNDPYFAPYQWNLRSINAPQAWKSSTGSGVTIGIVDTGITRHPDLNAKVVQGWDTVTGSYDRDGQAGRDNDATDPGVLNTSENWHGTHVAGIAAASSGNGIGVAGVAPDAKIQPVRALGTGASGYVSDFADAITWASGGYVPGAPTNTHPSQVVNFSAAWDGSCSPLMKSAVDGAHSRNVPVVVAAGNSGINADNTTPANCLGAIVVGATAESGVMTGYSNYGGMLDVVAPGGAVGGDVWSTLNTGYYGQASPTYAPLNGTSMASPAVAGTIALMKQQKPGLTVEQIRSTLRSTGHWQNGYPTVDAAKAVAAVAPQYTVTGGIGDFYRSHGGAGVYGTPLGNETGGLPDGGVYQRFSNNYTIYWSPKTGTQAVMLSGGIGATYAAGRYENGVGYPISGEVKVRNGLWYQKFRKASGATYSIYWSSTDGGHTVLETGAIGGAWLRAGRSDGWGYPQSNEVKSGTAMTQRFSNGVVASWTASTGVRTSRG